MTLQLLALAVGRVAAESTSALELRHARLLTLGSCKQTMDDTHVPLGHEALTTPQDWLAVLYAALFIDSCRSVL